MNWIKINDEFINLENINTVKFKNIEVELVGGHFWWYAASDNNATKREAFTAIIKFNDTDGDVLIPDAQPLYTWLNRNLDGQS